MKNIFRAFRSPFKFNSNQKNKKIDSRRILTRITNNWPAKMLSIALAIILFVFHRLSVLESRFFSTSLLIETGGNLVPGTAYPQKIRVSLRGEAEGIKPIMEDDIETYLDLKKYTVEGTYRTSVQVRKKGTAMEVEPLEINVDPMEVTVELDQKMSKNVPITPQFHGYPEAGYELVSYTLTPSQVVVEGPERLINNLTELSTDSIELGGRNDNFSATVHILNRDPLLVVRSEGNVEFHGVVGKLIRIRSFTNLPIELEGLNDQFNAQMNIKAGGIRLEGNQNELDPYEPQGRILSVDCSAITVPGTYTLPVQAAIPPMFTLIRTEPAQVTLEVQTWASNQ